MGAWFQVQVELPTHPKVARLRKKLRCAQCEASGIVVALFSWGVDHADENGAFIYEDEEDLGNFLRYANPGTTLTPMSMVNGLKECGWLDTTQTGLCIHDWGTWQGALYVAKRRRAKDALRKRESRKNEATTQTDESTEKVDIPEEYPQDSPTDIPKDKTETKDTTPTVPEEPKYTPAFSQFWDAYPRKIGKGEAYKKYVTRRKDGFSDEELLTAAKNYAIQVRKQKTDKQYIKHPKTFLSDTTPFVDYIPKKPEMPKYDEMPVGENPFKNWEDGN